jgi:hypothetical protein
MAKKRIILFTILLIFILPFALAQSNDTSQNNPSNSEAITKAYQCLQSQIDSKSNSEISLQEAIFGVLAIGSDSKLLSIINDNSVSGNHWSQSNEIKETSQVLIAYKRIGRDFNSIKSWLLAKEISPTELIWNLQIDIPSRQESSCTLNYNNEQKTITVNEDMTLTGSPGQCFTISQSGFWLRANNNCLQANFSISCDQDFATSLLYQRSGSPTIFVSPTTHSASALGTTRESINSKCFSSQNTCNYEGTLWATLAFDETGEEVIPYLPYLLAFSEENKKYLPSSFLHRITSGTEQYSSLVQSQQQEKYWQAPNTPYNRYYDSSLAILSLQGTSAIELTNTMNYFTSITTPDGCWNNNDIRDTAFLLYSGWPRTAPSTGSSTTCSSQGFTCESLFACNDLGGTPLEHSCSSGVCCSESPVLESCSILEGSICSSSETCSGTSSPSSDGSCCLGTCETLPEQNACEQIGGICDTSCQSNEEQVSESCVDSGEICCIQKSSSEGSSLTIWIIILSILIVLIVLGIVFRDKIRLFFAKRKSKGSIQMQGRPQFPRGPPRGPPPAGLRRPQPPLRNPQRQVSKSQSDREIEDTLKKLKEMGK